MLFVRSLAIFMAFIAACSPYPRISGIGDPKNSAKDGRIGTSRMARINLFDTDGCAGKELTIQVPSAKDDGCWNTENVQSISIVAK